MNLPADPTRTEILAYLLAYSAYWRGELESAMDAANVPSSSINAIQGDLSAALFAETTMNLPADPTRTEILAYLLAYSAYWRGELESAMDAANVPSSSINAIQGDLSAALFAEMARVNQARMEDDGL
jgi:uncharacterized membrane protein YhfC